jgi:hypothetical protein
MSSSPPPTAQVLAEAAAGRRASTETGVSSAQLMQEHEKRQNFRRLIDPGIFRPNSNQVAMDSLKVRRAFSSSSDPVPLARSKSHAEPY